MFKLQYFKCFLLEPTVLSLLIFPAQNGSVSNVLNVSKKSEVEFAFHSERNT